MTRLPDSPLDEPAPPPLNMRLSSRWSWTMIGVSIGVTILVSGIVAPVFMASGIATSESMFYAKGKGTHKLDGLMDGNHAIAKGECGYSYLSGLSSDGNPSRPIVVTPLIPGTNRFDPKPFEGKAVIAWPDL